MRANEIEPAWAGTRPAEHAALGRTPTQSEKIAPIDPGAKPFHKKARRLRRVE
jgi:hypothetical protein